MSVVRSVMAPCQQHTEVHVGNLSGRRTPYIVEHGAGSAKRIPHTSHLGATQLRSWQQSLRVSTSTWTATAMKSESVRAPTRTQWQGNGTAQHASWEQSCYHTCQHVSSKHSACTVTLGVGAVLYMARMATILEHPSPSLGKSKSYWKSPAPKID